MKSKSIDRFLAPSADDADDGLVVAPDALVMRFSAAVADVGPREGVGHLSRAIDVLVRGLQAPTLAAASPDLRCTDFNVSRSPVKGSKRGGDKDREHVVRVSGEVRLALAPDIAFWDRCTLTAELIELARALEAEGKRAKPAIAVSYSHPAGRVSEPERHRAALVERWVARARHLADTAQTAPLHLRRLTTGPVMQRSRSLTEVVLTLPIEGHLDLGTDDAIE